jgi:hypothetical protein
MPKRHSGSTPPLTAGAAIEFNSKNPLDSVEDLMVFEELRSSHLTSLMTCSILLLRVRTLSIPKDRFFVKVAV